MEQGIMATLQRILDAVAFDNVGHMRGFNERLHRDAVSATPPTVRAAPIAHNVISLTTIRGARER